MQQSITDLDIDKTDMIIKTYHYLYFCYYNLVSSKADHREDGASSLLTILDLSIVISIYLHMNIAFERQSLVPVVEGFGVFFLGVLFGVLNWFYFVKKKKYLAAINESKNASKLVTNLVGTVLLILPLFLFIYSGVKMSYYLRSIH